MVLEKQLPLIPVGRLFFTERLLCAEFHQHVLRRTTIAAPHSQECEKARITLWGTFTYNLLHGGTSRRNLNKFRYRLCASRCDWNISNILAAGNSNQYSRFEVTPLNTFHSDATRTRI